MLVLRAAEQLDQMRSCRSTSSSITVAVLSSTTAAGRVAALRLELTEVFGRHLPTLAGQLEQAVLVDVPAQAFGQVHQLKCLQPLDVFQHVPRVGFQRCWRSQSTSDAAAGLELQQLVQLGPMRVREWFDQGAVDPPIGLAQWLPSRPGQSRSAPAGCVVSAVGSPGPDRPAASLCRSAGPARLARAPGRGSRTGRTGPVAGRCAVPGMLATGHVALAVLCPARRLGWTCFATHRMTGSGSSLSVPSA